MKILITGGLGYVGGRLSRYFSENLPEASLRLTIHPKENLTIPSWLKNGEIIPMDLQNDAQIKNICRNVTHIIHLAAMNEHECLADPQKAVLVNGLGTLKLIQDAEKNGVNRFIYFSTAHIYKAPLVGEISEKTIPRPAHPYAITHKIAEDFVLAAHDKKIFDGIVIRMSNSFGAPDSPNVNRWTLLVNDLCKQAIEKKKLVLHSSGLQWRDFVALEDVCRCVMHFIKLPSERIDDGLFNLGGENSLRILDMVELIVNYCQQTLDYKPPIQKPEHSNNEITEKLYYTINKLKGTEFQLLGNVEKELKQMLLFCQKHFGTN